MTILLGTTILKNQFRLRPAARETVANLGRPSGTQIVFPTFHGAEALGYYRSPLPGLECRILIYTQRLTNHASLRAGGEAVGAAALG